ncbi:MAG: tetratricopeptide repeat protein [Prevotella sp.]|jgi:Flp pilus assembly protein TadD|nr:tetratricopeptide repeat protein [Prevotella sp.]
MNDSILNELLNNEIGHEQNLGKSIRKFEQYLSENPDALIGSRLEEIKNDYSLMLDYLHRGFHDPQQDKIYRDLLDRLFVLVQDVELHEKIDHVVSYREAYHRVSRIHFSQDSVRETLEGYVTEMAMVSLEPEETRHDKMLAIQSKHYHQMSLLFDAILVSEQWHEGDMTFYAQLILSPTIDIIDAQFLVSAIILACINIFDVRKLETLARVLKGTQDEHLRQKALVGWVFAMNGTSDLFPRQQELADELTRDESLCRELLELQEQYFYCISTDRDVQKIQDDIMPNLMKGNHFNITRFGMTETEDDPMNDVLHPEDEDKTAEDVEKGIQQISDMEKQGSDIYFGGFSQMKRFPFFYTLSNWFVPFYLGHPALESVRKKLGENKFLQILFNSGPFCDSDKYSFALAMGSIIDKIPDSVKEMLNSGEAVLGPVASNIDKESTTFLRRSYLQDLYRFFRLYPYRQDFRNPFENFSSVSGGPGFFFTSSLFLKTPLKKYVLSLARFLSKQGYPQLEYRLLNAYASSSEGTTEPFVFLRGCNALHMGRYTQAHDYFSEALRMNPDDLAALKGLAKSCLMANLMDEAEKAYQRLVVAFPSKQIYQINLCIARISNGKYEEAINELYKLDLDNPGSRDIHRVLAWALLCQGKVEQADKEYRKLLEMKSPDPDDYLNAGYCKWMQLKVEDAVKLFKTFMTIADFNPSADRVMGLEKQMKEDQKFLNDHGFTDTDIKLMCDLCA